MPRPGAFPRCGRISDGVFQIGRVRTQANRSTRRARQLRNAALHSSPLMDRQAALQNYFPAKNLTEYRTKWHVFLHEEPGGLLVSRAGETLPDG